VLFAGETYAIAIAAKVVAFVAGVALDVVK